MKHPAYQLRTNKAVDRVSLVSYIRHVLADEKKARYFSLSGPFLEDMKVMHSCFPVMKLISLEKNEQTYKRQQFHSFTSRLKLVRKTLDDYLVHDYEPGDQDFFWLDFTDMSVPSFQTFRTVLTKAPHLSVIRITLRAEPNRTTAWKEYLTDKQIEELKKKADEEFEKKFGSLLSHEANRTPFCSSDEFARLVQMMAKRVSSEALGPSSDRSFFHLDSIRYEDGTQMLSVTGLVVDNDKIVDIRHTLKKKLHLEEQSWSTPRRVDMPNLSILERHHLDKLLPSKDSDVLGKRLLKRLNYSIENGEDRSQQALRNYARHYLEYPSFIRANFL